MAAFLDAHPDDPALLVRYEDLVTHLEGELERIFSHLGLDPEPFDFECALSRPVRGSSTTRPSEAKGLDWHPVAKTDAFDPVARARHWTDAQHARFNHMAGDLSTRFGYALVTTKGTPRSTAVNLGRDILLKARNTVLRRWAGPNR